MRVVRVIAMLFLFSMSLPGSAAAACIKNEPDWLNNYDGSIGDRYQIRMTLVISDDKVTGLYFYASQMKDIALKGTITNGTTIVLDEIDTAGRVAARFEGKFLDSDPSSKFGNSKLECEVIVGTWQRIDSTQSMPVYLSFANSTAGSLTNRYAVAGAEDDNSVNRNVYRFWNAVRQGDKKTVASLVTYPIQVKVAGQAKQMLGPDVLIAHYDEIFSAKYREVISNASPVNLFVNGQGIMLGNGEVWFDAKGKVIALNN